MWKKRILCLALVLCAVFVLSACQKKETFQTLDQQSAVQPTEEAPQDLQNIFGETPIPDAVTDDFDDGSYNPASEEGGDEEQLPLNFSMDSETPVPTAESAYAGATPVLIDPIDKPTPTPLPPLTFNYTRYEATALRLSFEAPANWTPDESKPDTYTLTNPQPDVDYAAQLSITVEPSSKNLTKNELIKEVKNRLDTLGSDGFKKFERSNTAGRKFMNVDGIYANYTGTLTDGAKVAGRMIIACSNKTLYILHVSYPQGYTKTYVDGVYDKFRHSVKTITPGASTTNSN